MAAKEIVEQLVANGETLQEAKKLHKGSWQEIVLRLPENLDHQQEDFLWDYFRAQLRIAKGKRTKGARIINGLTKNDDFKKFEANNQELFAAIDVAVRGTTTREDNLGRPIQPAFRLNGDSS